MKTTIRSVILPLLIVPLLTFNIAQADDVAFPSIVRQLQLKWPKNRTIRIVFHGHSVPAGYFKTPEIRRFDSYPLLFQQQLCQQFPTAAIDVSVTAIGGENSKQGAARFADDVLSIKPDLVFIDYSLNDRSLPLEEAKLYWEVMIVEATQNGIPVVLLTPTPDSREDITSSDSPLQKHANQVKQLGLAYKVPVVDSYGEFQRRVRGGADVKSFLSQVNHPNRTGHDIVTQLIMKLFLTNQATSEK
ncbi:MAG: SGNH/GDSL hydrolase family protein [Fuerstiella sp.]